MTKQEAIIVMGFTGVTTVSFGDFHEDVEKRMGQSVFTHQFGNDEFSEKVKDLYRDDFVSMCESINQC
jgi:hypothetical protein